MGRPGFNPLHCGAVVASARRRGPQRGPCRVSIPFIAGQWSLQCSRQLQQCPVRLFQSPSLRGSGRFNRRLRIGRRCLRVSIPFIAGQWSLLSVRGVGVFQSVLRFNPLHCGAVVASGTYSLEDSGSTSFNPLHCGAVVASGGRVDFP